MTAGLIIMIYLAIGAMAAAGIYVGVSKSLDSTDPEVRSAMGILESSVGRMPGGMPIALVVVALCWPALIVIAVKNAARAGR